MGKSRVNQIPVNQLIKHEEKCMLDEEFLLNAMGNGNLLISRVSEIRVKQIRVNQGVGVPCFVIHFFFKYNSMLAKLCLLCIAVIKITHRRIYIQ